MTARDLFQQGDLKGAIDAQNEAVKSAPSDAEARTFLFELLCFAGNWQRAEKQLDVIGQQDVEAEPAAQVYRNVIKAEEKRRSFLENGVQPECLLDPPAYFGRHVEAVNWLREGKTSEATNLLAEAESMWPRLSGTVNDAEFEELRDCDDVLAPFFEFIIIDDFALVPWEHIRELEISPPERPRDLIWSPCRIELIDGKQQRGYAPILYFGSSQSDDPRLQLGRMTDWCGDEEEPVRGIGQKTLLAGDQDLGYLQVRSLQIKAG